jgi:uncharacterized LabA/DUF88 family protein
MRFQERFGPLRGAVYIDGFNLYHRLHEYRLDGKRQSHLKWLDLNKLSSLICARHSVNLVKTLFCTAVPDEPADVRARHVTYNTALKSVGVDIERGHHVVDQHGKRTEKQSDINLALHLICDAQDGKYDCAYILSSDSDQAATARIFKNRFPEKFLIGISPPGNSVPSKLKTYSDAHFELTMRDIEKCLFDYPLVGLSGKEIPRPPEYTPPIGWIAPT